VSIELDALRQSIIRKSKKPERKLKVCMIEAAKQQDLGSIGVFYIVESLRSIGVDVDVIDHKDSRTGYDIELVSVHHVSDYDRVANMPLRGKIRIIGGHVTYNNPRPIIPFTDVVCVGDGESWIVRVFERLERDFAVESLADMPGIIITKYWEPEHDLPSPHFENPLPLNPPYLNRANTRSATWYIEIARGCPYRCDYCELGHSMPYRYYTKDQIRQSLAMIDSTKTHKVNWFAPDEASHPDYAELMDIAMSMGYRQAFGSYRIDQILKHPDIKFATNQLVRVGVDGLSEGIRKRVHKNITNKMLIKYFRTLSNLGHTNFKMFMMFGYPFETLDDFREWESTMHSILSLPTQTPNHLRIKWTPLIPQPVTPLGDVQPKYNPQIVNMIKRWHTINRAPKMSPGWHVENDGLMGMQSHAKQVRYTRGDEFLLIHKAKGYVHPNWR